MRLSENLLKTYKIRQILFFLDQLSTRPSFHYINKKQLKTPNPGMIESVSKFLLNETISNGA